jgi:ATP-binding cassette subfamily F protein uup
MPTKLSYRDQRERDLLPGRIAALEAEIADLAQALADPELYQRNRAQFQDSAARLDAARAELIAAEERWLEIELAAEQAAEARAR